MDSLKCGTVDNPNVSAANRANRTNRTNGTNTMWHNQYRLVQIALFAGAGPQKSGADRQHWCNHPKIGRHVPPNAHQWSARKYTNTSAQKKRKFCSHPENEIKLITFENQINLPEKGPRTDPDSSIQMNMV